MAAGRTNTFLGERYRRITRRRGAKRAIVAVGRSILIIVWHLLSDPTVRYQDLGPGFYDTRINAERRKRTTSANSKRSATRSPSNPLPDPTHHPASTRRSAAEPGAAACLLTLDFRIRCRVMDLVVDDHARDGGGDGGVVEVDVDPA